jgi:hypothetical protein
MWTRLSRGLVVGDLRDRVDLAAQPRDDPRQDHHQPVRAGVDHARIRQHLELLGGSLDRLLPCPGRHRKHLGQELVLLGITGLGGEPLSIHVGQVLRGRVRHLADHRQHRPLGGVTHRLVCGVGGARERGRDQNRVHQLPGAARQLLGGAADDLAQDHTRVPARPHQGRPGHRVDDLVPGALVHRLSVQAVQLAHHGAHGQGHVVPGVAVGDREHVQIVDLLAALLEVGVGGFDDPAKPLNRCVNHHEPAAVRLRLRCRRARARSLWGIDSLLPRLRR